MTPDPTRTHAPADPSGSATRTADPHTVRHPQTDDTLPASTGDSTRNADGFAAPPGFVLEREIGVGGMGVVCLAR